jgi:hypothetical protein
MVATIIDDIGVNTSSVRLHTQNVGGGFTMTIQQRLPIYIAGVWLLVIIIKMVL